MAYDLEKLGHRTRLQGVRPLLVHHQHSSFARPRPSSRSSLTSPTFVNREANAIRYRPFCPCRSDTRFEMASFSLKANELFSDNIGLLTTPASITIEIEVQLNRTDDGVSLAFLESVEYPFIIRRKQQDICP